MFQVTEHHPRLTLRVRRSLAAATAVAAIVVSIGAGASAASAAPGRFPINDGFLGAQSAASPSDSLRAALEALPDSAEVPVGQIVKNFTQGVLR